MGREEANFAPRERFPLLVVLSGPSGAGKDAVLEGLRQRGCQFHLAITATTRPPRPGEVDGCHYHFLSPQAFQEMLDRGEFLEHAEVYGQRYGVPREELRKGLAQGKDTFLKVDVQGAATIKKLFPQAVLIFLAPATDGELEERLRGHLPKGDTTLAQRWASFPAEMEKLAIFDYLVINHQGCLEQAVQQVLAIVKAERCRVTPRRVEL